MGSLNRWIGIGNLGRDAELRYTQGGTAIAKFSIACTETWTDKNSGERQERTEWVNVDLWGKQAESVSQYLTKGKQVCVEGRLQTDEYTDKDGIKRKATRIRCDRVTLLGSAGGNGRSRQQRDDTEPSGPAAREPEGDDPLAGPPLTDDDIPFAWLLPLLFALPLLHRVVGG